MANDKKKIGFIVNPKAGTTTKKNIPELINSIIDLEKFDIDIVYTEAPGHAHQLARKMAEENFHIAVAVGGDGTMNEVASALVHTNTALGIIPCGSGNGLARHLGIPLNIKEAISLFNYHRIIDIDYGTANDIKFFCTCGVGFDAHVGHIFAQNQKRGFWTYVKSVLGEFVKYKAKKYIFKTIEHKFKKRAFLITFANASQYGNDAFIAPHADIQDGLIDVCVLEPFPPLKAVEIGVKLMKRKIDQCRYVQILKASEIKIKRKKKDVFHYDGEPCIMKKKIVVRAHPKGLKVAVLYSSPLK